ncbi:hypothetical protein [Halobacillus sp. K22]|uniref:hypothetical protein n=1 Tax=Halobacillus sp. K22 TaxID=3457431 RepID=UPI003FCCC449
MRYYSNSEHQDVSEGLLKHYNKAETPSSVVVPITSGTSEKGLQVPLSLKRICTEDRVELISTIKWITPLGGAPILQVILPVTDEVLTTNATSINYILEVPITFNVYRDEELIYTAMDVSTLLYAAPIPSIVTSTTDAIRITDLALRPLSSLTGAPPAATTTFQCVDTNVPKGDHVYTITAQISRFSLIPSTTVLSTTSTEIPLIPIRSAYTYSSNGFANVTSVNFSGKVIDGNRDECPDDYR